jgi:hypothetical protein
MDPEAHNMAQPRIYEGTAEEIAEQLRGSDLNGRLKAVVTPQPPARAPANGRRGDPSVRFDRLRGYGLFAHVAGGSEAFALDKQAEIEREDRVSG